MFKILWERRVKLPVPKIKRWLPYIQTPPATETPVSLLEKACIVYLRKKIPR